MQLKKQAGVRIETWNVSSMTGRGPELLDVMERRKIDIMCGQENGKDGCADGKEIVLEI